MADRINAQQNRAARIQIRIDDGAELSRGQGLEIIAGPVADGVAVMKGIHQGVAGHPRARSGGAIGHVDGPGHIRAQGADGLALGQGAQSVGGRQGHVGPDIRSAQTIPAAQALGLKHIAGAHENGHGKRGCAHAGDRVLPVAHELHRGRGHTAARIIGRHPVAIGGRVIVVTGVNPFRRLLIPQGLDERTDADIGKGRDMRIWRDPGAPRAFEQGPFAGRTVR